MLEKMDIKRKNHSWLPWCRKHFRTKIRTEVPPVQTNGVKMENRVANVNLHSICSNLKRIRKISAFFPIGKFLRTPTDALILMEISDSKCGVVWFNYFRSLKNDQFQSCQFPNLYTKRSNPQAFQFWRVVNSLKTSKISKRKLEAPSICPVCPLVGYSGPEC